MSKKMLLKAISKQTNITKLQHLKDVGLSALILKPLSNIAEADRADIVEAIDAKIAELSA